MSNLPQVKLLLKEFEQKITQLVGLPVKVLFNPPLNPSKESFEKIAALVTECYGLKYAELFYISRRRPLPEARFVAMYVIRQATKSTKTEIAEFFNVDHTSVIHGINAIEGRILINDETIINTVSAVIGNLYEA
jgi:chromosomal replication initiation ATPase DnaA